MDVRMPDGTIIRNVPEGTTKMELGARYARYKGSGASAKSLANAAEIYSPTEGMGAGERFLAGTGKALYDLARGAGQLVGAVSAEDVAQARALDAPLMATTAGKVGNFAGNVAAAAPAAFVPGANTVVGAGVVGAGLGLLQPTETAGEKVRNTLVGGAAGAAGQKLGQWATQKAASAISRRTAEAAEAQAVNAVRDTTLAEARSAGYVIPPSTTKPSVVNRVAESVSGKAATQQSAMVRNQRVTNRLARDALGLPRGARVTKAVLEGLRSREGKVYEAVKRSGEVVTDNAYLNELTALSRSADQVAADFPDLNLAGSTEIQSLQTALLRDRFSANGAVEAIKELRREASKNLAWTVEDPAKKALGLAQREAAGIVEDQLVRHLQQSGQGGLASRFDNARRLIAKSYSVQAALNEGTGNIVATKFVSQLRKGKPLSGQLELIAKFASAFPKAAGEQTTSPGVSAVDALIGAGLGTTVNPSLMALPVVRIGARGLVLSRPYQNLATAPNYAPRVASLDMTRRLAPLTAPVAIGLANTKQQ